MTGPASGCTVRHARMPEPKKYSSSANWWPKSNMRSRTNRNYDWSRWPMGRATTGSSSPELPPGEKWWISTTPRNICGGPSVMSMVKRPLKAQARFEEYRHLLLKAEDGVAG
ncbi:MAG: hypothetical protein IPI02_10410 [Sterolibacteriaceae bacterium]|nr:hypothetical protein [Sterolibacteriaceae bacterium]